MNPIIIFPKETNFQILSQLNLGDVLSCCCVDKVWHQSLINWDQLWQTVAPMIEFPKEESHKKYLNNVAVCSFEGMIKRSKEFIRNLPLGQKGFLNCRFPLNNELKFSIEIIFNSSKPILLPSITKHFIFIKSLSREEIKDLAPYKNTETIGHELLQSWAKGQVDTTINYNLPKSIIEKLNLKEHPMQPFQYEQLRAKINWHWMKEGSLKIIRVFIVSAVITVILSVLLKTLGNWVKEGSLTITRVFIVAAVITAMFSVLLKTVRK